MILARKGRGYRFGLDNRVRLAEAATRAINGIGLNVPVEQIDWVSSLVGTG